MKVSIYHRRRFHSDVIKRVIWLLKNNNIKPDRIVTDRLGSYRAALKELKMRHVHDVGGRKNNHAENSHLPIRRRERKSQKFRSIRSAQKQLSSYGQIYNLFNYQRHLISRKILKHGLECRLREMAVRGLNVTIPLFERNERYIVIDFES